MAKPYKRFLVGADLHCGHRVGLTPPKYQNQIKSKKYYNIQQECWNWYLKKLKELQPIDIYCLNGDLIDGKGSKSGATELITSDVSEQGEMASVCIKEAKADHIVITRGTAYHVSPDGQDIEDYIGKDVKADKVEDHGWYDINGVIFDVKHHIGNTSVPYGKGTPISKDQVHNLIWSEYEDQPRGKVFIRSHVHWYFVCGDSMWMGFVTPALQAMGTKFGARRCSAHVDFGLIHFDVYKDGSYIWTSHVVPVVSQRAKTLKL